MAEKEKQLKEGEPVIVQSVQVVLMREKEKELEVFLGHRIAGGFLDQWSFPGGRVDDGESDKQAACREVEEETNVDVLESDFIHIRDTESITVREKAGGLIQYTYKIKVFTVDAQHLFPYNASPDEHSEMRWMRISDALAMHEEAVLKEQTNGVSRSPDKIPGAIAPRALETLRFLSRKN